MNRSIARIAANACAVALLVCATAQADFIPIANPDAGYVAGTTLLDVGATDFDIVPLLSDALETVSFDVDLVALTVPGTWSTWGSPPATESATPRVLWSGGFAAVTMKLSAPASTFGFEAEPAAQFVFPMLAEFFSANTLIGSIALDVDGNAGALLFAASTATDPFDKVVLSSPVDFAIARVRYSLSPAQVPEPGSAALVLVAACAWLLRRRRGAGSSAR